MPDLPVLARTRGEPPRVAEDFALLSRHGPRTADPDRSSAPAGPGDARRLPRLILNACFVARTPLKTPWVSCRPGGHGFTRVCRVETSGVRTRSGASTPF